MRLLKKHYTFRIGFPRFCFLPLIEINLILRNYIILWYTCVLHKILLQDILIISYESVNIYTGIQLYTKNLNIFCFAWKALCFIIGLPPFLFLLLHHFLGTSELSIGFPISGNVSLKRIKSIRPAFKVSMTLICSVFLKRL